MIEITHAQAQHLIRAGQDGRRLPDEQWTALQAHLERCFVCRAYRVRLNRVEHDLGVFLHDRWRAVEMRPQAQAATVPHLLRHRRRRDAWQRFARKALPYALILLAVLAFFVYQQIQSARRVGLAGAQITATAAPTRLIATRTPTPGGGPFTELLAFAELVDGSPDIILLNPAANRGAGERTNLTQHPASDIHPAWSPDGEWIAFLSDRNGEQAGGKFELYVISIAGTRLTRLTNRADIGWSGPLTWSADGKTIALAGRRSLPAARNSTPGSTGWSFVYLVPLDGSGPRSLAFSATAPPLAIRYSPAANLLAYSAPNGEGLLVYHQLAARYTSASYNDSAIQGLSTGTPGSFDWSTDGRRLAYLAGDPNTPGGTQIKVTLDLFSVGSGYDSSLNTLLRSAPPDQRLTALSWLPDRSWRVLAFLQTGADAPDCAVLELFEEVSDGPVIPVPGLCVLGSDSPQQWARSRADGAYWLLVTAREQAGGPHSTPGYYAIHIPRSLRTGAAIPYQRLASADLASTASLVAGSAPAARPRPDPDERIASIDPRPAAPADPPPALSAPPASLHGTLVFSEIDRTSSRLRAVRPDGSANRLISETNRRVECPVWSPDGQRLALLSDRASAIRGAMEVFVVDGAASDSPNDDAWTQLTDRVTSPDPLIDYAACPAWSPDGTRLALSTNTRGSTALIVLPVDGSQPLRLPLRGASQVTPPAWAPDGQRLLVASPSSIGGTRALAIRSIDLSEETPKIRLLLDYADLDEVLGMVVSPTGQVAFVGAQFDRAGTTRLTLYTMRLDGSDLQALDELPAPGFPGWVGRPSLAWLPDGSLFYPIRQRADERYKTSLWIISPTGERRPLAYLEDLLIETAWSTDGRWLAYTSDAGLFLLDKQAALQGRTAPVLLTDQRVNELDWK